MENLHDEHPRYTPEDGSGISKPLIGAVSPVVAWKIGREDTICLRRMVARLENAAHNLLVFRFSISADMRPHKTFQ